MKDFIKIMSVESHEQIYFSIIALWLQPANIQMFSPYTPLQYLSHSFDWYFCCLELKKMLSITAVILLPTWNLIQKLTLRWWWWFFFVPFSKAIFFQSSLKINQNNIYGAGVVFDCVREILTIIHISHIIYLCILYQLKLVLSLE